MRLFTRRPAMDLTIPAAHVGEAAGHLINRLGSGPWLAGTGPDGPLVVCNGLQALGFTARRTWQGGVRVTRGSADATRDREVVVELSACIASAGWADLADGRRILVIDRKPSVTGPGVPPPRGYAARGL